MKKDREKDKVDEKKIEVRAELDERPAMGPVVEEVHVIIPKSPKDLREKTLKFLEGIEIAYAVRARDGEIKFEVKRGEVRIFKELEDGTREMRYYRKDKEYGIIFCDEREYANLRSLGLIKKPGET